MTMKIIALAAAVVMIVKVIYSFENNDVANIFFNGFVLLVLSALGRIYF